MEYSIDNKRIVNNTLFLYARTIVVLLVALYTARILLNELGVEDYGIYNVVGSVVILFSFLNTAMTQAAQRFITFELGAGNCEKIKKVFSMVVNTQFIIMLLIAILAETIGLWFLNFKLSIPIDRIVAANIVYQVSIFTFIINVLKVPYEAAIIAHEKMNFFAYVSFIDAVLKLGITILLTIVGFDKLITYAVFLLVTAIIIFIIYLSYCYKNITTCKYVKGWDKILFWKLFSFSGWSLCGSTTDLLTQKGFVFLLNIFFGIASNAALGIANQVSGALRTFINSFQTAFKPQIVKSYAANDMGRFCYLIAETSKFSFLLIILPILFIVLNMPLLLEVWLGSVPEHTVKFCQLMAICGVFDALTGSFYCAILSSEKIKYYQIIISLIFCADLVLSFLFIKLGIVISSILYSRILTRGLLNMIVGLLFLKYKFNFSIRLYTKQVLNPIIVSIIPIVIGLVIVDLYTSNWTKLFISAIYIFILGIPLLFYMALSKTEQNFVIHTFKRVVIK